MLQKPLWDKVAALEGEVAALPPAPKVRKRDLVRLAVFDFANRGEIRGVLLLVPDLPRAVVPFRGRAKVTKLPPSERGPQQVIRLVEEPKPDPDRAVIYVGVHPELEAIRTRFVTDLDAISAGKDTAELIKRVVVNRPVIVLESSAVEGRRLVVSRRYLFRSFQAELDYVLARLLADQRPGQRSDLRRCRLPGCREFFFCSEATGERGAPRISFCSAEHAEDHRRLTVTERVRRSRAGKKQREQEEAQRKRRRK